jgi:glutamate-ammonia-ligase adenylyltransferase
MRAKIDEEKGTSDIWELKHVAGGLIDAEFLTQFLQLTNANRHPGVLDQNTAGALSKLVQGHVMPLAEAERLVPAVELYHTLTQILRLCLDRLFVPDEAPRALKDLLARATGLPDFTTLELSLKDSLAAVRDAFERIVR